MQAEWSKKDRNRDIYVMHDIQIQNYLIKPQNTKRKTRLTTNSWQVVCGRKQHHAVIHAKRNTMQNCEKGFIMKTYLSEQTIYSYSISRNVRKKIKKLLSSSLSLVEEIYVKTIKEFYLRKYFI